MRDSKKGLDGLQDQQRISLEQAETIDQKIVTEGSAVFFQHRNQGVPRQLQMDAGRAFFQEVAPREFFKGRHSVKDGSILGIQ